MVSGGIRWFNPGVDRMKEQHNTIKKQRRGDLRLTLPPDLHAKLAAQAAYHRRPIQEQARLHIERGVSKTKGFTHA